MEKISLRLRLLWSRIVDRCLLTVASVRIVARNLARLLSRGTLPVVKVTYDIVTPESAEHGDTESSGWIDETGQTFEPDKYDILEGKTRADLVAEYLESEGVQLSEYCGDWYTAPQGITRASLERGEDETHYYHLHGFSVSEENEISEILSANEKR